MKRGMFNHRHITSSGVFVMVMVLVIGTDACGSSRRSPPSKPKTTPEPSTKPSERPITKPQKSKENLKTCMLANISW